MSVSSGLPSRVASVLAAITLFGADIALAQAPAAPASPQRESKWEIEVHGGLAFDLDHVAGSSSLPVTGSIIQGMISASTFYFGEGARLFNQNQTALTGGQSLIAPLDAVLSASSIQHENGPSAGGRVQVALSRRFAIEGSGEYLSDKWVFRSSALSGIDATQASYTPALQRTLAGTTVPSSVTSVATVYNNQSASRAMATGALVTNLSSSAVNVPYVVVGAGILFNGGTTPAATLKGDYQLGGPSVLLGTDAVTLHYIQDDTAIIYLGGGGFKRRLSRHTGIRFDARMHFYKASLADVVDVSPVRSISSTGAPLPVVTLGALQFSSTSPLNGPSYTSVATFTSSGLQPVFTMSAGFVLHF